MCWNVRALFRRALTRSKPIILVTHMIREWSSSATEFLEDEDDVARELHDPFGARQRQGLCRFGRNSKDAKRTLLHDTVRRQAHEAQRRCAQPSRHSYDLRRRGILRHSGE